MEIFALPTAACLTLSTSWGCDSISQPQFLWGGTWWAGSCRMHLSELTFSLLSQQSSQWPGSCLSGYWQRWSLLPLRIQREFLLHFHQLKSNWFTESFCGGFLFLGFFFMCALFHFRFSWIAKPRNFCERSVLSSIDQFVTGAAEVKETHPWLFTLFSIKLHRED